MPLGRYCTGLWIYRSTVADGVPMPSVRLDICHGAVVELVQVYGNAHNILHCLFPDMSTQDWKAIGHKVTMQTKRLKAKNNTKLGEYLVKKVGEVEKEGQGKACSVRCDLLDKQILALKKELHKAKYERLNLKLECSDDVLAGKEDVFLKTLFITNTHRCVVAASYQIRIGAYLPAYQTMSPFCGHFE